jgi:hypothetical protein
MAPPLPVLPLCTAALRITVSYRERQCLKSCNLQCLKLYELDFLHGTVLNVAHGMIAICIHACTLAAPAHRQSSTRGALALDSVAML